MLAISRRLPSLPRLNKTKVLQTQTKVLQTRTYVLQTRTYVLQTQTKVLQTRTLSTQSRYIKGLFNSKLLVSVTVAGLVSGFALWRYTTSPKQKAYGIEEALCEEERSEVTSVEKSVAQTDKQTDGDVDDYDRRLCAAIAKTQDLLYRAKDESGAPGIVAAISVDGRCLWSQGLGYCDVENRTSCSPMSVLRVASISKSFTMTLVAKLMEEGKLDIDKAIQEYVPKFPEKTWKGEKVKITTRQLLSHLSGIRHYSKDYIKNQSKPKDEKNTETIKQNESNQKSMEPKKAENIQSKPKDKQNTETSKLNESKKISMEPKKTENNVAISKGKQIDDDKLKEFYLTGDYSDIDKALELFQDDPLVHKPGSKYLYSTYGWTLISAIVEAAGGRPFLKQMTDVFRELDMMYTVPDEHTPLIYNRAKGYSHNKNGRLVNSPFVNLSLKWAGGGYLSTVDDLVKFGNAMLYSYQYNDKHKERKLPPGYLKPETMATIWKPVTGTKASWDIDSKYAMGWAVVDLDQAHGQCRKARHLVSHTGGAVGFSSVLLIVPPKEEESTNDKFNGGNDIPPKGVVVAIVANLGATGLYKTSVKIAEIFKDL